MSFPPACLACCSRYAYFTCAIALCWGFSFIPWAILIDLQRESFWMHFSYLWMMYIYMYTYVYIYIYTHIHIYVYIYTFSIHIYIHVWLNLLMCISYVYLPAPMNHVKIFKGQPRRFALSELVQACYNTFPPDHFGQVEINDSTMLRNKTSTA